jgi:ribonuclease BN (tRNA processing enzyme)
MTSLVSCALVDHTPVTPAFSCRLDAPDRSIVISGDTKTSNSLIELAHGVDVLVDEVIWPDDVDECSPISIMLKL